MSSPTVIRLLATVSIVALAVTVAAPASTKSAVQKIGAPSSVKSRVSPSQSLRGNRRGKRSVVVQVPVVVDDGEEEDEERAEIENELSQLSDDQLEMLAAVVQNELEKYNPDQPPEQYQYVDIPVQYYMPRSFPRDRRSIPTEAIDNEDDVLNAFDDSQMVVVPEEVIEEALMEQALEEAAEEQMNEELDELELRARIGEMADILNERASRRMNRRRR